ncbi:glycosyltransferase family 4 protein [Alkalihalobacterium chitinilyticum]|uniref:Glycosyltransferase family 1 protein n=1 Tax=Alkalihalobacterium chitinilyticum TaxID=2980103 RepID=A0ABT5VJQ6_9BACI|nr:glycosyltransferase family 1 protein [Alkalihalobacterium chitinilyticum]MDE5415688.1 glycosyltransferase family 1 protein [Alkalihalobacterium chitinilyticum]
MKIALFTDTFTPQINGVARTLQRLVNHFEHRNVPYQLFVPETIQQTDMYSNHIHSFFSLPFFLYPECRMALPNLFTIRQQMDSFKPDLIHITTPFNIGLSGLHYGKKHNIPMVGSYHTHFDHYLKYYKLTFMSEWLWKFMKWFYSHFNKTFVPSKETKTHLAKRGFTNIELWTRGVDCFQFSPQEKDFSLYDHFNIRKKYVLLYVGRMAPEKDLDTLRLVMEQLPEQLRNEIHWIYVGDGPLLNEYKERFNENITFTGYLAGNELASIYALADLFVFPSTTETFGNVVLEALASGTPAIVANKGGVTEIVHHEKTGLICEAKKPQSFISAIEKLLTDHTLRLQMGYEGRKYAKTQSWETIFDNLLIQYEKAYEMSRSHIRLASSN